MDRRSLMKVLVSGALASPFSALAAQLTREDELVEVDFNEWKPPEHPRVFFFSENYCAIIEYSNDLQAPRIVGISSDPAKKQALSLEAMHFMTPWISGTKMDSSFGSYKDGDYIRREHYAVVAKAFAELDRYVLRPGRNFPRSEKS